MKLTELCRAIGLEHTGDDREITGIQTLETANETELSFVENERYLECLNGSKAAAVLVRQNHADRVPAGMIALITAEPYLMMAKASVFFARPLVKKTASARDRRRQPRFRQRPCGAGHRDWQKLPDYGRSVYRRRCDDRRRCDRPPQRHDLQPRSSRQPLRDPRRNGDRL